MKKKLKIVTSSLAFHLLCSIVIWFALFNMIASASGYASFTSSLTAEYNDSAFRTAKTAAKLVDGDKIDEYLETGGQTADYQDRLSRMNILCQELNVSLIYVISVDTTDYGSFVSVFNTVNQNSGYTPWEVGYERQTSNEEYRAIYQQIYENGLQQGTIVRTRDLDGSEAHITSLIPINDSAGDVTAILCVQRPMAALVSGRRQYLVKIGLASLCLTALAVLIAKIFLDREFVTPIERIIGEAKRFARENRKTDLSDFRSMSKVSEIKDLAQVVEKMENDTMRYMENLTRITAERERISTELALAAKIQADELPNCFPAFPDRDDFSVFASMTPAKEVGGDFYDFFLIDSDHLGIVMADVSGKGVPAALFMMAAKNLVRNYAMLGSPPHEVLEFVNRDICRNNVNDMFVTVWFGIVTLSTGCVTAASAGHEYPAVRRGNGPFELFKDKHGFVIGGLETSRYRDYTFRLAPGDALFLYTDGIPEATSAELELFGVSRMLGALSAAQEDTPESVLESVNTAVQEFVGQADQFDDLTMLCFRLNYLRGEASVTLVPDAGSTARVADLLSRRIEELKIPPKTARRMRVAADELFSNIVRYSGAGMASVTCLPCEEGVRLVFEDDGIAYDPTQAADPDTSLSAEEREIGGLGIFVVRRMASRMEYARENGRNRLTVVLPLAQ